MLFNSEHNNIDRLRENLYLSIVGIVGVILILSCGILIYALFGDSLKDSFQKDRAVAEASARKAKPKAEDPDDRIENGIHVATGLVVAEGFEEVKATCTACHSAKLVTQNRASREGWKAMIEWMQETQGLWQLGKAEDRILDYLAANYAPEEIGRRANLEEIEWYILEE